MSTRREFLKQAALAGVALSTSSISGMAKSSREGTTVGKGKLKVAVVGVNSRGRAIAGTMAGMDTIQIVAICDCDIKAMNKCIDWVEKYGGYRPEGVRDYRKLLERKDIEAVVIAMPDHWHATAAIMAMHAGKDVYLEKPTSYCPEENALLLEAEKKSGRIVQAGMQRRSYPVICEAVEALRNGVIGEVKYAKCWYATNRKSIGVGKVVPVPENLDWELWQGPAPRGPQYKDNLIHYNWHWHWHWGTGEALNNGTHYVDLVRWGMGLDEYPTMVSSIGGRYHYQGDDWETPDTQLITFQFGNKASFSWEGRSCDPSKLNGAGFGATFFGENGKTLTLNGKDEYVICDARDKVIKEVKSSMTVKEGDLFNPSEALDTLHFQNWVDAIRKGDKVNDPLWQACMSTQYTQYGNIAQRLGKSIAIDPKTGKILGCPEAKQYWSRKYDPNFNPKKYLQDIK